MRLTLAMCLMFVLPQEPAKKHRGYLGAGLAEDPAGLKVTQIVEDAPAAKAGLAVGDVILRLDGEAPGKVADFVAAVARKGPGAAVRLDVRRGDRDLDVKVDLVAHPQDLAEEPDPTQGKVRKILGLAYGSDPRHRINLILPDTGKPFPTVLWIHAGAWSFGDRANETALGVRFAERGVGFAAISHRLSRQDWHDPALSKEGVVHPAHVEDCARAFAWLHANVKTHGGDPARLFVSGHSSGGHLAALLALDGRYLKDAGAPADAIRGAIPIGGAYDLVKYHAYLLRNAGRELADGHLKSIFGPTEEDWRKASPSTYAKGAKVPMLVLAEEDAAFQQYAKDFEDSLDAEAKKAISFWNVPERTHGTVTVRMARKGDDVPRERVLRFIRDR